MQAWKLAATLLFVLFVGLLAWLVEYLTDRFRPDLNGVARFVIMFLLAMAVGFAALQLASAHDHKHAERNEWLQTLHAKDKTWCCNGDDTDEIDAWEAKADGYRVKYRGQWFDVPESAIVDAPNKTGEALLWMSKGYLPAVRCFMPGSMT